MLQNCQRSLLEVSETNCSNLNILKVKLTGLVECILEKAANDNDFAKQLEEILLSDSLYKKEKKIQSKSKNTDFNPLDYLSKHSKPELKNELSCKTDDELKKIFRSRGSRRSKDIKNIERDQLIEEIILETVRNLNQGWSIIKPLHS